MKLERKKLEILFAILVIFTIGSILTQNQTSRSKEQCSQEIIRNKSNTNPIIDLKNPKTSEFWNVPFIHINGNWSATNISYPWCYGSGKINDPYVIENVSITLTSTSHHGIVIQNSTIDYFVINNCTITGFNKLATDGIVLMDSNNGTIINNNATKCNFGFFLHNCNNLTIIGNNISYNKNGMQVSTNCINCTVSGNIANYNDVNGFILYDHAHNNVISENFANDNTNFGIYLNDNCNSNNVSGNTISNNTSQGICIYNSCKYNNISRNIIFNNNQHGIYINTNCDNNTISNNIVTNNKNSGLDMWSGCDYNIISGNKVNNNTLYGVNLHALNQATPLNHNDLVNNTINYNLNDGIRTYVVRYSEIINNTVRYNNMMGVRINYYSSFNDISSNTITNCADSAVYCENNCLNNTVSNNTLSYSLFGLQTAIKSNYTFGYGNIIFKNSLAGIYMRETISNNQFHNNEIFNNSIGVQIGTSSKSCSNNNIYNNIIANNLIGVEIFQSYCNNNTFYNNSFINNGIHAIDNSTSTKWYKDLLGNYWDNYTGVDADDNGIGDTPYTFIGGSANNQDPIPIWWDAAVILVNFPTNNYLTGVNTPNFAIELTRANYSTTDLWYRLWNASYGFTNNQSISALSENINGNIDQSLWNLLGNGTVIIQFFANDSRGWITYTNRTILKNLLVPIVFINDTVLYDGFICSFSAPSFIVTLRANLASTPINYSWYRFFNGTWSSKKFFTSNGTIDQILWNYQLEGSIWIYFYVNDSIGNEGSNLVLVYKDITLPQIAISAPSEYAIYGYTSPIITLIITEIYYDSSWYSLNNFNNTIARTGGKLNQTGWDTIPNGTITIRFYSVDLGGNINYRDFILRVDIITPVVKIESPGYGTKWGDIGPVYKVTVQEPNIDDIYFTIEFEGDIIYTASVGTIYNGEFPVGMWDSLPNGQLKLTFYVRDRGGNIGSDQMIIIKEGTTSSSGDDSSSKGSEEGLPFWIQAAIAGAMSALAGVAVRIIYGKVKKEKKTIDAALVKFDNIENKDVIKDKLKDKFKNRLNDERWLDFEELWKKYEHQDISRRDMISRGKKTLGDDFIQILDTIPIEKGAAAILPKAPLKLKAKPSVVAPIAALTEEEKKEIKKTESEVGVEAPKFNCIVHKGPIEGEMYLCPHCKTLYCVKCATTLMEKGEKCWSCDKEIKIEAMQKIPSAIQQQIQELEKKLESLKTSAKNIDDTYYTGALGEEEYLKVKSSFATKIKAIIEEMKELKSVPPKSDIKK